MCFVWPFGLWGWFSDASIPGGAAAELLGSIYAVGRGVFGDHPAWPGDVVLVRGVFCLGFWGANGYPQNYLLSRDFCFVGFVFVFYNFLSDVQ